MIRPRAGHKPRRCPGSAQAGQKAGQKNPGNSRRVPVSRSVPAAHAFVCARVSLSIFYRDKVGHRDKPQSAAGFGCPGCAAEAGRGGTGRCGVPLIQLASGECGPDVAAICAEVRPALPLADAAALLRVSRARVASAFALQSPRDVVPIQAILSLCRAQPGDVWLWQRTYAAKARP